MCKKLSKLFVSAATTYSAASTAAVCRNSPVPDLATKKRLIQAPLVIPYPSTSSKDSIKKKKNINKLCPRISSQVLQRLKKASAWRISSKEAAANEASTTEVTGAIISILEAKDPETETTNEIFSISGGNSDMFSPKNILDVSWFRNRSDAYASQQKKELSRNRKQKYMFKNTESYRFRKLMKMCATKIGTESTLEVFGRFGRETGIKDYNALINLCLGKARRSSEEDSSVHIHKVYQLFVSMRERGFQIEEESFGPFLEYMIDAKMVEEFQTFSELIKDANPGSHSRIGYYEMLLWIRVGDEDKIQELCNSSGGASHEDCYNLAVSYLLAFCESDRKEELLQLLEVLDITSISAKYVSSIFKSLGRLQLGNFTEKFILALNVLGDDKNNVSSFIYDYATSIPNLTVEEIISNFINLHEQLKVLPSIISCDMLIKLCCNLSKVHASMEVVELIRTSGLVVPDDFFDPLLHACERSCEFNMVHPIYSAMHHLNLKPKGNTFKSMISLCVRMKDFEGAYNILTDAKEINGMPTTCMYNAIMAGYFREKNSRGALMVLKQMHDAGVQPDSETYCYLIANCGCEEDVFKYRDKMRIAGVETTKHVYMALINAFAKFGNFDLAKQVVLDPEIQTRYLNEIKSVLVSALSSNGQLSDALDVYDEIKQAGGNIEPKAIISLIEHIQSEGELSRLLQLLEDLEGLSNWFDGCSRVILYCVQHKIKDSAIDLLNELKKKDKPSTCIVIDQVFSQIWKAEPVSLEIGLELLSGIKEELHLCPSRTSLDFLLSACVKARKTQQAQLIWSEYERAGLAYNVLTFLRMYQALLASGDTEAASKLLKEIPKDDPHVSYIIESCRATFMKTNNQITRIDRRDSV